MTTVVKLKRSDTASAVPSGMADGELAVNRVDGRFYLGPAGGGTGVEVIDPVLRNARLAMTRQAVNTASASLTIDLNAGWHVSLSLAHTLTSLSLSNVPASGRLCKVTLDIANTGAFAISAWPAGTKWAGGAAPTITSGAGKLDTIILTTTDAGTTWRGYVAAQNLS